MNLLEHVLGKSEVEVSTGSLGRASSQSAGVESSLGIPDAEHFWKDVKTPRVQKLWGSSAGGCHACASELAKPRRPEKRFSR